MAVGASKEEFGAHCGSVRGEGVAPHPPRRLRLPVSPLFKSQFQSNELKFVQEMQDAKVKSANKRSA